MMEVEIDGSSVTCHKLHVTSKFPGRVGAIG
jgi:hypothetical protein